MIEIRMARERDREQYAVSVRMPTGRIRTLEPGEASLILKGVVEQWEPARLGDPVVLTISEPGRKLVVADNKTLLAAGGSGSTCRCCSVTRCSSTSPRSR